MIQVAAQSIGVVCLGLELWYGLGLGLGLYFQCECPVSCLTEERFHHLKSLIDRKMSDAFLMHIQNPHRKPPGSEIGHTTAVSAKEMTLVICLNQRVKNLY